MLSVSHWLLLLSLVAASLGSSSRLKTRIYEDLRFSGFCFRRTNASSQVGCSSSPAGDVGVALNVNSDDDVQHLLETGSVAPYVAVFDSFKLLSEDKDLLAKLAQKTDRVAGVIVIDIGNDDFDGYSDDKKCPNQENCQHEYNAAGTGNLFLDVPFPVFLLQDAESADFVLNECISKFNLDDSWPYCSLQLASHMHSAVDTETCLRRNGLLSNLNPVLVCDKMADLNIFYNLKERKKDQNVMLLMTTIDTLTLFDQREMGADSPVLGLVALLETARIMSKVVNEKGDGDGLSNVIFAFMYGESFDYSASSRLLYDIEQKQFPNKLDQDRFPDGQQPQLSLADLSMILDVGQLFNLNSEGKLYLHNSGIDASSIESLLTIARNQDLDLTEAPVSYNRDSFPPSSLNTFLKSNHSVKGALMADFDETFTNAFFHSVLDDRDNVGYNYTFGNGQQIVTHISKVALTLSKFFLNLMGYNEIDSLSSNSTLINELLHCYLDKADCSMFIAAGNRDTPPIYKKRPLPSASPLSQYVGVESSQQFHGIFTRNLLTFLTSHKIIEDVETFENCFTPEKQDLVERIFLRGYNSNKECLADENCGQCYETWVFRRSSLSPAFVIEDYDFKSGKYPAWAESFWKSISVRAFIQISPLLQWLHLLFGVIVTVISFGLVLWMRKHSSTIFSTNSNANQTQGHSMSNNVAHIVQEPQHL